MIVDNRKPQQKWQKLRRDLRKLRNSRHSHGINSQVRTWVRNQNRQHLALHCILFTFRTKNNRTATLKGRNVKQTVRKAATICPSPCKLTFDLLTLKVVSESRLCATFSLHRPLCSRLRPDVRDRQTSDIRQTRIIAQCPLGRGITNDYDVMVTEEAHACLLLSE